MQTLELPKLTAAGIDLDMGSESFGYLNSSADIVDDGEALRDRLAKDGYLFIPGFFEREDVIAAREVITGRLDDSGCLAPGYPVNAAVAKVGLNITFRADLALNNPPLDKLLYSGKMIEFYERFFGEEVRHYDYTWFRATAPGKNASPHCDVVYMGRGTFDLLTAWTPLGDILIDHGVLMILEGSHLKRQQLQDYLSRDVDTYCSNGPKAAQIEKGELSWEWDGALDHDAAALRRRLGGRWLTANFKMGDLLTFTMGTVHCSADNKSDLIRLSSDSRYQRASEPADERWIGANPIGHGLAGKRGRIC